MTHQAEWPLTWPTNPLQLEPPPSTYPDSFDQLTTPQLQLAQQAMVLMCGRSKTPLKTKHRAIICVLSTIIQAALNDRQNNPQGPIDGQLTLPTS